MLTKTIFFIFYYLTLPNWTNQIVFNTLTNPLSYHKIKKCNFYTIHFGNYIDINLTQSNVHTGLINSSNCLTNTTTPEAVYNKIPSSSAVIQRKCKIKLCDTIISTTNKEKSRIKRNTIVIPIIQNNLMPQKEINHTNVFDCVKNKNKSGFLDAINNTFVMDKLEENISIITNLNNNKLKKWEKVNLLQNNRTENNVKRKLSILGLFELSSAGGLIRPEGYSELAAAQLAVRHINENEFLPGYDIELLMNDTKCDPGVGVDRLFHAIYTRNTTRIIMLLGSACSEVTESLAKIVPYWNIVQVSYGSTSPALSDRRQFPLFYRTVAPDSSHNLARIAFIRHFNWDTVTTFSQNGEIHSLAVNDLVTELESANISCATSITFAETDFQDQLKMLRELDTRIIIGSFSQVLAPKIFCEAYKLGMYGTDYAWILHESFKLQWWKMSTDDCTQFQIAEASENVIIVSSHNRIIGNAISFSGLTNAIFLKELKEMGICEHFISRYAVNSYDAVWAIAFAMHGVEEHWRNSSLVPKKHLHNFDYTRYDITKSFLQQFSHMKFLGVSGPVSFSGADRIGISIFLQIQNGELKPIALYHPSERYLNLKCFDCEPIKWMGGQVPIAKRIYKLRIATIAQSAFYTISCISSVGILLSISFLAFNSHFRKFKSIKLSSPKLSNIIAVGCILVYAAVILLGLDYSTINTNNDKVYTIICTLRVYLLSSGFSLAFGSMFAKTYRVHRIFIHTDGGGVCRNKLLRNNQLISMVCVLLLLDGLLVTLWAVTDPMERYLSNLSLEISLIDRSVVYQPQVEVCRSNYTQRWLGILYAYKGLLLIVGVYMAWETRHIKIPALNDSEYIGVSVYSVVITSIIVVMLGNLIAERVTLAFVTTSVLILTSTTATLSLLFLPKIYDICSNTGDKINDTIIHSMGLKMESNTRRLAIDDRQELQYRVEVQNRVFKKEIIALDAEILKLQKMLKSNLSSSSDLSLIQSIKHEIAEMNECIASQTENSGLLLSISPPCIPRASWPLSDKRCNNHTVTFSSQPKLDFTQQNNQLGTSVHRVAGNEQLITNKNEIHSNKIYQTCETYSTIKITHDLPNSISMNELNGYQRNINGKIQNFTTIYTVTQDRLLKTTDDINQHNVERKLEYVKLSRSCGSSIYFENLNTHTLYHSPEKIVLNLPQQRIYLTQSLDTLTDDQSNNLNALSK